jgi:hypothetical protein
MGVETEEKASVVDPHWFQCGSGSGSTIVRQCGYGSRVWWPKIVIFVDKKNSFFIKNSFLSRPPWRRSKLHENPSALKRTFNVSKKEISSLFSVFVGHFCPPGSSSSLSRFKINGDPCGSGSTTQAKATIIFRARTLKSAKAWDICRRVFYT